MKKYCLFVIVCLFGSFYVNQLLAQEKHTYENIVFEGAGIRGIAYCGVIKVLESENITARIKRVGGTSAGAITALLLSLGYTADEIYTIVEKTPFQKFNDGRWLFIGGINRSFQNFGWYRKRAFEKWLAQLIEAKTGNSDITFEDLKQLGFKDLYVIGTCLNQQKTIVFSVATYPKMKVIDAVSISMSIPLYFEASFIDKDGKVFKGKHKPAEADILIDGGLMANFPIEIFDSIDVNGQRLANFKSIGVRIDADEQIELDQIKSKQLANQNIENLRDYIGALYVLTIENLNRHKLTEDDWQRTISVSSKGIGPKIKKLSQGEKQLLMLSGEVATRKFLGIN